jgi:hypothetical protein
MLWDRDLTLGLGPIKIPNNIVNFEAVSIRLKQLRFCTNEEIARILIEANSRNFPDRTDADPTTRAKHRMLVIVARERGFDAQWPVIFKAMQEGI